MLSGGVDRKENIQLSPLRPKIRPLNPLAVHPLDHRYAVAKLFAHPRRRQASMQAERGIRMAGLPRIAVPEF